MYQALDLMQNGDWQVVSVKVLLMKAWFNGLICGMFLAVPYLQMFRRWETGAWDPTNRYLRFALLVIPTFLVEKTSFAPSLP